MCVRAKKKRFFFSYETYTKIIVIDLINIELIRSLSHDFFLQKERVFHVNICVIVCDCYFWIANIVIILFGTQQVISELKLE